MKIITKMAVSVTVLLLNYQVSVAQDISITDEYKEQAILKLSQLMNDFYVFPEIAKSTEVHLMKQLKDGYYNQFKNDESFAEALTQSVQSINNDKHMRIRKNKPYVAPENTPERIIEERVYQIDRSRRNNFGFNTVKVMEGNVGYLDLRGFAGLENAKFVVDSYMSLMSRTDAIIIDLSKNGGGSPEMVQYLCSYFFDKKVHLNSLYYREGDRTTEFWTLDKVDGMKMPDVPLFVITGNKTFSAAEEFSYNMQTQERATLVGQTSGGGANPGRSMGINQKLSVFIPTGKAINPITMTNWEGIGVVPEVKTTIEETLDETHKLAKVAAEAYRLRVKEKYSKLFMDLHSNFEHYTSGTSEKAILEGLTKCKEADLFEEWNINNLGYDYLMEHNNPKIAACIFRANTILYPNSANVFDSYAESLMLNGDLEASLKNYQKAVDIATEKKDESLQLFIENLESLKGKM
jgi:C-terminal processing protease CtpA/Prc